MGQYHLIVNVDRKEYLDPHDLGAGLKLGEFLGTVPGPMAALGALLAVSNGRGGGDLDLPGYATDENGRVKQDKDGRLVEVRDTPPAEFIGRWGGDRIVIIGDYGEPKDYPQKVAGDVPGCHLYSACRLGDIEDQEEISRFAPFKALYATDERGRVGNRDEDTGEISECHSCGAPIVDVGFKNVSEYVKPLLEKEFGIRYIGTGWSTAYDVTGYGYGITREDCERNPHYKAEAESAGIYDLLAGKDGRVPATKPDLTLNI